MNKTCLLFVNVCVFIEHVWSTIYRRQFETFSLNSPKLNYKQARVAQLITCQVAFPEIQVPIPPGENYYEQIF